VLIFAFNLLIFAAILLIFEMCADFQHFKRLRSAENAENTAYACRKVLIILLIITRWQTRMSNANPDYPL
jgi:hypothetical protein